MTKKLVSLLLSLTMLLCLVPTPALAEGTNITNTGLDFSGGAPASATDYITNNGGTVHWQPADGDTPATLTFENATIQVSAKEDNPYHAYAIRLPSAPVTVVFKGTNSITALNYHLPYAIDCQDETEFVLSPDSTTTLTAAKDSSDAKTNAQAYGISTAGHNVTIKGSGTLNVVANGGYGSYAIDAGAGTVTLKECTFSPKIYTDVVGSTVTLDGITVPNGGYVTIVGGETIVSYDAANTIDGVLDLKQNIDIDEVLPHVNGNGTIKINSVRFFTDGTVSADEKGNSLLDLSYYTPTVKTAYTTGGSKTIVWEPTLNNDGKVKGGTLTFTNATMEYSANDFYNFAALVTLPAVPVTVVLNGTNNFTLNSGASPTYSLAGDAPDNYDFCQFSAFLCLDKTTFIINGETNITAGNTIGMSAYALNNKAHDITVLGPGTLNMSTSSSTDKAEIRSNDVTVGNGVTISGVVKPAGSSGTIHLGSYTGSLNYSAMGTEAINILDVDTSWYDASEDEFTLTTPEQLAGLSKLCNENLDAAPFANKTVKLGADIDLDNRSWTPIWWNGGNFDGQGYAITGLNVTEGVERAVFNKNDIFGGLFAYAYNGAKLCNFTVSGSVSIAGGGSEGYGVSLRAGGVVGCNVSCTIINVGSNVNVTAEGIGNNADCFAGGITGYTWRDTSDTNSANCILNSYANGNISVNSNNYQHARFAGGIAGASSSGPIVNCYYGGTSVTGDHAAGITYSIAESGPVVDKCYSNFGDNTQAINGTRYADAADLLAKLNDSTVLEQIETDHGATPMPWKMGTNGMPVLAFPPKEQFINLTTGKTYWFDISEQEIPGDVNTALPDTTLHYVPFTYAGTVDAYVLNKNSAGVTTSSEAANIATATDAQYGYRYDHSLFVAKDNVKHNMGWDQLNGAGFIFGKEYVSGGVGYTLRAPTGGSSPANGATPVNNEWSILLDKISSIISQSEAVLWMQDTSTNNLADRMLRCNTGYETAFTAYFGSYDENNCYRPVLEVRGDLASDALKAVALNLNGGKLTTGTEYTGDAITTMNIVYTGASFTAPTAAWLTRPADLGGDYFMWLSDTGDTYAPGANVPNTVTTLTAQWVNGAVAGNFVVKGGVEGTDYEFADGVLTVKSDKPLVIGMKPGVDTTTNRIKVDSATGNITLAGVNIETALDAAPLSFDYPNGTYTLTLADDTENVLRAAKNAAGILVTSSNSLTIGGNGTLKAYGATAAAGIGGGSGAAVGSITINGGNITAVGGSAGHGAGAGIGGGGESSSIDSVTITGGVINATAGVNGAAGIGGGGHDGTLTALSITGGFIIATGKYKNDSPGSGKANAIGGGAGELPSDLSGVTSAVIIDGTAKTGSVYGNAVLNKLAEIPAGVTLTIPKAASLTIGNGGTLTNNGIIMAAGTLATSGGTITGSGEMQCPVAWNLTNVKHDKGDDVTYASTKTGYSATLTADQGFALPASIGVKVGESTLSSGYTYSNGTLTIESTSVTGTVEITATGRPLFTDAGVTAVSVGGKAGTIDGTTIDVVLDFGTTIPSEASKVSITPATGATVGGLATTDGGKTWTFTVTAEDGTTKKNYTINVSVAPDPAAGNKADVAAAKSVIEVQDWTVAQNTANTEAALKTWVESELAKLNLNGVSCTVTVKDLTAAVAGNKSFRSGTNGSYGFTVALTKGEGAAKADGTADVTKCVITAAAYVVIIPPENTASPVPAQSGAIYNDNHTMWLTSDGLLGDDILIVAKKSGTAEYDALLKLANGAEVMGIYDISLRSGRKSIGSAMYLHFDLAAKYAGETFTLVHQKADKTYEYFTATADANGDVKFGALFELSPFMLVRGEITRTAVQSVDIPQTGDTQQTAFFVGVALIALLGAAVMVRIIRRRRHPNT